MKEIRILEREYQIEALYGSDQNPNQQSLLVQWYELKMSVQCCVRWWKHSPLNTKMSKPARLIVGRIKSKISVSELLGIIPKGTTPCFHPLIPRPTCSGCENSSIQWSLIQIIHCVLFYRIFSFQMSSPNWHYSHVFSKPLYTFLRLAAYRYWVLQ